MSLTEVTPITWDGSRPPTKEEVEEARVGKQRIAIAKAIDRGLIEIGMAYDNMLGYYIRLRIDHVINGIDDIINEHIFHKISTRHAGRPSKYIFLNNDNAISLLKFALPFVCLKEDKVRRYIDRFGADNTQL